MIGIFRSGRSVGRKINRAAAAAAALALVGALALTACETGGTSSTGIPCPTSKALVGGLDYKLGVGDRLKVTVVGQPELGGEAEVDAGGKIVIALAGEIMAADRTVGEVQSEIFSKLKNNILIDPRIAVQVIGYRPVTVLGLVKLPGRYPFSFGLDVRGASALAGGLERRASPDRSVIFRPGGQCDGKPETPLFPGDTVEILRRGG
ncbi:MAG: polysaccharide export protein [Alphaproteobacteria bacterium]|nr:polysaccharide export protein [Alphaproteobacteria bacterium]